MAVRKNLQDSQRSANPDHEHHPSATLYVLCSEQNRAALDLLDEVSPDHVITITSGSLTALAADTLMPQKPLSCSPCLTAYNHRRSPCDGNNVCLKSISPEEVLAAANELLGSHTGR